MATYAIGDIQGCFEPFQQLLTRIRFDPAKDHLWLVGDLVNRGPRSLDVLRFLVEHRHAVHAVLGNHDIYALARAFGVTSPTADETLAELMAAPDRDVLIAWLLTCPVLFEADGYAMVHAGLLPAWDLATARREALVVETALTEDPPALLGAYFNRKRHPWSYALAGLDRAVAALAVFTRIRFVDEDGRPVSGSGPAEAPPVAGAIPWFKAQRGSRGTLLIFGHWASLGLWIEDDVMALDSGCVWNGSLTAVRIEDRAVFSISNRREDE